jgi:crotonobetainyl-CoA:carnitine CoA-transferase CaiB-like acyl-CoA transferase
MSACEGLRVVELAQGMAGPMVGQLMADYGADVIKVEPPSGDWARARPGFSMWNRGKTSVTMDLRTPSDTSEALDLLQHADVAILSWRPGVAERLGFEYESIAVRNPRLIWAEVSGFGSLAGLEDLQGYEGLVSAALGKMSGLDLLSGAAVGHPPDDPLFTSAPANTYTAAHILFQGVAAALIERRQSGYGQKVSTSLAHGASAGTMRYAFSRDPEEPGERLEKEVRRAGLMMAFTTAECKDGRWIQMCARQDHHFRAWLQVLGLGHVLEEERYRDIPLNFRSMEDIKELDALIREQMRLRTQSDWMRIFIEDVDVGADPFLTPEEFMRHPQMVENDRIRSVEDPTHGTTIQPGALALLSETPANIGRGAPPLAAPSTKPIAWPANESVPIAIEGGDSKSGPLEGVTILEVAHYLAGPLGATVLAELGARVIKVEPLTGDSFRRVGLEFVHLAHGKESIAIELKSEQGREILTRLLKMSDVLLHNFRKGVPERLGFGYDEVHERFPRLVYVNAASYGSKGPQTHRAAMHSTPNALCGAGIIQAGRGNPPVDESWPDPAAGIGVATGIMLGLLARQSSGVGQYVETTMLTSASYVYSDELVLYPGRPPMQILDAQQRGPNALYRLYECKDGWLFLGVVQEDEWLRLTKALRTLDLATAPGFAGSMFRAQQDAEIMSVLAQLFSSQLSGDAVSLLRQFDVPIVALLPNAGFESALVNRGFMEEAEHPTFGRYWKHPPTTQFSRNASEVRAPCGLGEHTATILMELGYSPDEVDLLETDRVVSRGPSATTASAS